MTSCPHPGCARASRCPECLDRGISELAARLAQYGIREVAPMLSDTHRRSEALPLIWIPDRDSEASTEI